MNKKGFTLIEVIIVAAIIGIIAAVAIPNYDRYVVRSKRADGMGALLTAVNAMERFRGANNTYVGATAGGTFAAQVPPTGTAYYNVALSNLTATTYTITATPTGSMAGKEGALVLQHNGIRRWTDKNGTAHNCWPESGDDC